MADIRLYGVPEDANPNDVRLRSFTSTSVALGLSTETDTAYAFARFKAKALGLVSETETAYALTAVKRRATGLGTSTSLASALAAIKQRIAGLATETDSASALAGGGQLVVTAPSVTGGWGYYNDALSERRRRKRLKELQELEEEADRLEAALIASQSLPENPELSDRIKVREYADYVKVKRTQRAIEYALRAKTALAYQLAAREIAKELEDEEHAVLLTLAMI